MIWQVFLIGAGGFLGSICRFGISGWLLKPWSLAFPYGTLAVNVLGCALIGYVFGLLEARADDSESVRAFMVIGFLGGFTTFSAFSLETLGLLQEGHLSRAFGYIFVSVMLCLVAVAAGYWLVQWLHLTRTGGP